MLQVVIVRRSWGM